MRRRGFITSAIAVGVGASSGCISPDSKNSETNRELSESLDQNEEVFQSISCRDGTLVVQLDDPPLIAKYASSPQEVAEGMYADEINIINATTDRVVAEDDIDLSATDYAFSVPEGTYRVSLETDKTSSHHSRGGYVHLYARVTVEDGSATVEGYGLEGYIK